MAQNYVLLERIELNQSASSVTFSNIPQTGYTDLKIVASVRDTSSNNLCSMYFNGDTNSANYSNRYLLGDGTGTSSGTNSSWLVAGIQEPSGNTANTFASGEFYIPNYTSSNQKSVSVDGVQENNATGAWAWMNASKWSGTAAITSVTLAGIGASFASGSTFSLYGIANANTTPARAPKASGGNVIATDGTYWYHAFLSNGTFTPQVGLSADVLVVAGGGGGSGNISGGGGGGGLLGFTSQALTATSYTCTIGAGGSTGSANNAGTNGGNSQFGSLTAAIGGGAGRAESYNALSGGSGGGARDISQTSGSGTSGQGNAGGATGGVNVYVSAGGGGAAAVGGPTSASTGSGAGGAGATYNSTVGGSAGPYAFIDAMGAATNTGQLSSGHYYYAGGGGGGGYSTATTYKGEVGGLGGGGNGGYAAGANVASTAGTANTGGGGGGGRISDSGSAGGSGIIIIRYAV